MLMASGLAWMPPGRPGFPEKGAPMHRPLAAVLLLAAPAAAQSLNIDFGPASSLPPATYGGVGRAGTWSTFESLPTNVRFALVDLFGRAIPARLYNNGGTALLTSPIPGASGGDAALMNDMFLSFNNPTDLCLWVEHLQAGTYDVIIYALTPDDPTRLSRVRVDSGSPGPTMVGGAWPGSHVAGVTYATFTVSVSADGTIGLHSGLAGANIQSGINGLQLIRHEECYANCDGSTATPILSVNDFICFQSLFAAANPTADCDHSGALNVNDFICFQNAFALGCP
jgi:hypothetical protein